MGANAKESAAACKERSRAAFDAQASTYDDGGKGEHARRLYPHASGALEGARGELLDIGCGTGALARLVLEQDSTRRVTGVDLSPNMAARARDALRPFGGRARIVEGDSDRLPFRDESFDAAYCNDSFHHYPDPEKAAFEAWRVLRPGALFVVGDCWLPAPGARGDERRHAPQRRKRRAHLLRGRAARHPGNLVQPCDVGKGRRSRLLGDGGEVSVRPSGAKRGGSPRPPCRPRSRLRVGGTDAAFGPSRLARRSWAVRSPSGRPA